MTSFPFLVFALVVYILYNSVVAWFAVLRNQQPEVQYCKLQIYSSIMCKKLGYFYFLNLQLLPASGGFIPWSPPGRCPWTPLGPFCGHQTPSFRLFHFLSFPICAQVYIVIPLYMTLTFSQGHSFLRNQKLLHSFSLKFLNRFGRNLVYCHTFTTCWFVEAYAKFISQLLPKGDSSAYMI